MHILIFSAIVVYDTTILCEIPYEIIVTTRDVAIQNDLGSRSLTLQTRDFEEQLRD